LAIARTAICRLSSTSPPTSPRAKKAYEIYLSTDGKNWGKAVATGEFLNTASLQTASLDTPVTARYLKFVANSEIKGRAWTSAAEIGIEVETSTTAIDSPHADSVSTPHEAIYDLQGRKIANNMLSTNHLPKGIYIQNGHKILK